MKVLAAIIITLFFMTTVFPPFFMKTVPVWRFSIRNVEKVCEMRQLEGNYSKNIASTPMLESKIPVCR